MLYFFALLLQTSLLLANDSEWGDVQSVCFDTGKGIFEKKIGEPLDKLESMTNKELLVFDEKLFSQAAFYGSFVTLNAPSVRISEYVLQRNLLYSQEYLKAKIFKKDIDLLMNEKDLTEVISDSLTYIQNNKLKAIELFTEKNLEVFIKDNKGHDKYLDQLLAVCNRIKVANCSKNFVGLIDLVSHKHSNIPIAHEMLRFVTSANYASYFQVVIEQLLLRAKLYISSSYPKGNVYDEVISILVSNNVSHREAQDFAHVLLGMYGTRGATFYSNGLDSAKRHNYYLQIFSVLISHFNNLKEVKGAGSYFLPQKLISKCQYGKPYHFWMAAYISYFGLKQGFDKKNSFTAAFMTGMAYDILANYNGRDPYVIYKDGRYSLAMNAKRLDNAFRIFGARFGASKNNNTKIDLDRIIVKAFNKSVRPVKKSEKVKTIKFTMDWFKSTSANNVLFSSRGIK